MSRSIQLQPEVEALLQQQQQQAAAATGPSTGLLLGQSWDARVIVLAGVATPPLPVGGGWTSPEWFTEHARQVKRMLVGGVEIIGAYIVTPSQQHQQMSEGQVRDLVYSLPLTAPAVDRYLVRASPKLTCEVFTGAKKEAIKPKPVSALKVASCADQLVAFHATLALDLTLPVDVAPSTGGGSDITLKAQIKRALERYHARLLAAPASIDGSTAFDLTASLEKAFDGGGKSGKGRSKSGGRADRASAGAAKSDLVHEVDFFLRPSASASLDVGVGLLSIRGACQCRVYAHHKSTVGQALVALRHDALQSLQARLQLLSEDAEETAQGAPFALPTSMPFYSWHLPRRVFVPLLVGDGGRGAPTVCDYLLAYEKEEDARARVQELLGVASTHSTLEERCPDAPEATLAAASSGAPAAAAAAPGPAASSSSSTQAAKVAVASKSDSSLLVMLAVGAIGVGVAFAAWHLM